MTWRVEWWQWYSWTSTDNICSTPVPARAITEFLPQQISKTAWISIRKICLNGLSDIIVKPLTKTEMHWEIRQWDLAIQDSSRSCLNFHKDLLLRTLPSWSCVDRRQNLRCVWSCCPLNILTYLGIICSALPAMIVSTDPSPGLLSPDQRVGRRVHTSTTPQEAWWGYPYSQD